VKNNLEAIGIIGMDDEGNFEFSNTILDDDMEDIEKQGLKMIKPFKAKKPKKKVTSTKKIEVEKTLEIKIPKKYTLNFSKNEAEEAELVHATIEDLGNEVEIKDIFSYVMTKGFSSIEKDEIRKIASTRLLEEKLTKYLKDNKLKMDREELLLHFLNEKLQ
jgi:hypothetical protein